VLKKKNVEIETVTETVNGNDLDDENETKPQ
jgi:hypothetical protein